MRWPNAKRSPCCATRAVAARFVVALLVVLASAAQADDEGRYSIVPVECDGAWSVVSGPRTPAARDAMLSLAACMQDAGLRVIDREERVAEAVQEMYEGIEPALRLYMIVFESAPDEVKVRAAYAIGLAEMSLMTRARLSLADATLGPVLEDSLVDHARVAYMIFDGLDRLAASEPGLFADPVNRLIARDARVYAQALRPGRVRPERRLLTNRRM